MRLRVMCHILKECKEFNERVIGFPRCRYPTLLASDTLNDEFNDVEDVETVSPKLKAHAIFL